MPRNTANAFTDYKLKFPSLDLNSAFVNTDLDLNLSTIKPIAYTPPAPINYNNLTGDSLTRASKELFKGSDITEAAKSKDLLGGGAARTAIGGETPWYQDGEALQGYAGLASSLLQAVALPGQMKFTKLQTKGLEQNLAEARVDSKHKADTRKNLSAHI